MRGDKVLGQGGQKRRRGEEPKDKVNGSSTLDPYAVGTSQEVRAAGDGNEENNGGMEAAEATAVKEEVEEEGKRAEEELEGAPEVEEEEEGLQ